MASGAVIAAAGVLMPIDSEAAPRKRVGLVLSGGGAKGMAHIGVLKVLEREGIRPDYITGTSMGALVGGLYAAGYSAAEIEHIVVSQNWNDLLSDRLPRRSLSIEEKIYDGRYVAAFPIRGWRLALPRGVVAGQNVSVLLAALTEHVHRVSDFSRLPIPFRCIATDVETGKMVVLDSGFLPEAMRASMSIPSAFAPVDVGGRLLVDGGITMNLPAGELKKMGADIIIGVDVGSTLYPREMLTDMKVILDQTIVMFTLANNQEQRKLCTVIIDPDCAGYTTSDFTEYRQIIRRGEAAAERSVAALRRAVPRLENVRSARERPGSFVVTGVGVTGLATLSEDIVLKRILLRPGDRTDARGVSAAVESIYGSQYFERVTYRLEPDDGGYRVVFMVTEMTSDRIYAGLRYDSDLKAAILLNVTLRNKLIPDSRLFLEGRFGDSPVYSASALIPSLFIPYFSWGLDAFYRELDIFFYERGKKLAEFNWSAGGGELSLRTTAFHSQSTGLAAGYERTTIDSDFEMGENGSSTDHYLNARLFYILDTLDRTDFPRSGVQLSVEARGIWNVSLGAMDETNRALRAQFSWLGVLPLSRKFSLITQCFGGGLFGEYAPEDYFYYFGGQNTVDVRLYAFHGLRYMEVFGRYAEMGGLGLQFALTDTIFLIYRLNALRVHESLEEGYGSVSRRYYGHGITAGVNTPVGPVEVTAAELLDRDKTLLSFNLGFKF